MEAVNSLRNSRFEWLSRSGVNVVSRLADSGRARHRDRSSAAIALRERLESSRASLNQKKCETGYKPGLAVLPGLQ